ncbi:hypothetical protein KAFR_0I00280 [Kazachstania africana CBS 2517]|uniref:Zn(2)-C6 fungal-type domain-containing protein n=1 Tax=Kazachstania africana (strain ATCC 22294 / BCRC 22015 / CBS 2517 / CECT 1963 / NBRC 1671 / NRRL Y-8276) TaxID=1071382 RepID=H2AZK9_KAZAF|nr:hypothetical protein KAFR_0I00280 [Kazachstania africana CBS 2517]CCF59809.1 hypothetical protein KAFR_0I00280 [Kazachstania africana CBS 2517]
MELTVPSSTFNEDGSNALSKTVIEGVPSDDPRMREPTKLETKKDGKTKRHAFACVRCHSLKQKCVPSDSNDIYRKPCQRCLRQKIVCKFDLSKRIRKKRKMGMASIDNSAKTSPAVIDNSPSNSVVNDILSNSSQTPPSVQNSDFSVENKRTKIDAVGGPHHSQSSTAITQSTTLPRISDLWHDINQNDQSSNDDKTKASNSFSTSSLPLLNNHQTNFEYMSNNGSPSMNFNLNTYSNNAENNINTQSYSNLDTFYFEKKHRNNVRQPQFQSRDNTTHHQYHLNHAFKKQLQSLLINQKDKIQDISNKFTVWSHQWNQLVHSSMFLPSVSDPISIGILSEEEAQLRLDLYRSEISKNSRIPFIKLPNDLTIKQFRKDKPIFFSVIMSVVSILMNENQTTRETIMKLDSFVINLITNQIFKVNNKSIEVIEAHVTLCMWYNFLEWSSKTRYHLFNYIGCCLTKDLGPTFVDRSFAMFSDEDPYKHKYKKFKTPLEIDPNGPRLTLLVYITSLNISLFLRQTIQARWGKLNEAACHELSKRIELKKLENQLQGKDIYDVDDDEILVTFTNLNHILERIHVYLHEFKEGSQDDGYSCSEEDIEYRERYVSKLVNKYQSDLDDIFKKIPSKRRRLLSFYYSVEAYLHQFKTQHYLNKMRDKPSGDYDAALINDIRASFISCYNCCISSLKQFLNLSPYLITSLPLFHMSRIIYTVGLLLLKLRYSVVSLPIFHNLISITDESIEVVKDLINLLEETSRIYPFNNFLYKFQYVVALFGQTYANKVTELAECVERNNTGTMQFNSLLLNKTNGGSISSTDTAINPKVQSVLLNQKGRDKLFQDLIPRVDIPPSYTPIIENTSAAQTRNENISNITTTTTTTTTNNNNNLPNMNIINNNGNSATSPSIASDNLNDYLTDMNSLAWGFNALNDEFWTDLFINDL